MARIINVVAKKNARNSILAVREAFRGKDLVNIRECLQDDDTEFSATKAGFTIPAEQFADFYKALRKFGRAAGLLGKAGDDDFEMKSLAELKSTDDITLNSKAKADDEDGDKKGRTGIKRKMKEDDAPKRGRKAKDEDAEDEDEDEEEETPKRGRKAKEEAAPKAGRKAKAKDDDADSGDAFSIKAFKKAIKAAMKNDDDTSYSKAVLDLYKANRKKLKDVLPKHAVNALEKSLESKKDEALLAKAIIACDKHIVQKDFSM